MATRTAGVRDVQDLGTHRTAEIFDPATGSFSPTDSMVASREQHVATRLVDGRVLVAGGFEWQATRTADGSEAFGGGTSDSGRGAEVFDPRTGAFTTVRGDSDPLRQVSCVLLSDERVLLVGTMDGVSPASSYSVFDPATGSIRETMRLALAGRIVTPMPDGCVLILGHAGTGSLDTTIVSLEEATGALGLVATLDPPRNAGRSRRCGMVAS